MISAADLIVSRLNRQLIGGSAPLAVRQVVTNLGFVQAQDYLGALWALGLRCKQGGEKDIEKALAEGQVVRTWPARGTLHFVAAEDVYWILDLLTPRVISAARGRLRALELDEKTFTQSRVVLEKVLLRDGCLTRPAAYQTLETAGISTQGQRGIYILWRLAQEKVICFGPRAGKQQTFVLLEEWVRSKNFLAHDEALAELARRYFSSRGPATLTDFVWWSGLTQREARQAVTDAGAHLAVDEFGGQMCWQAANALPDSAPVNGGYLLPPFDEYLLAYKDRDAVLNPQFTRSINAGGGMLNAVILINGQVMGTWKRVLKKNAVLIQTQTWGGAPQSFGKMDGTAQAAFEQAAAVYGAFLGLPVVLN